MSRIQRTQGRDGTRLRIEPLEDRRMLAQYAFAMNLYQDAGGVPGDLLTNDSVEVGDSFFVEITAEDLRAEPLGLQGLGLRVRWDPQVLEEVDTPFDPGASGSPLVTSKFPLYRDGNLDNAKGVIDWLQGSAFLAMGVGDVIGDDGPERFALLRFRAEQPAAQSPLSMRVRGGAGFVPMRSYTSDDLRFELQTIDIVARSAGAESLGNDSSDSESRSFVPAPTARWQNPVQALDVDGMNGVTPLDALITINFINEHVGDSALPPLAADPPPFYYDVNGDNLCTPQDVLLVINFLRSAGGESPEGEADLLDPSSSRAMISATAVLAAGVQVPLNRLEAVPSPLSSFSAREQRRSEPLGEPVEAASFARNSCEPNDLFWELGTVTAIEDSIVMLAQQRARADQDSGEGVLDPLFAELTLDR